MPKDMNKLQKGDYFVLTQRYTDDTLFSVFSITHNAMGTTVYRVYGGGGWPEYCVVPATPEEIEAQRRLAPPVEGLSIELNDSLPTTINDQSRLAFERLPEVQVRLGCHIRFGLDYQYHSDLENFQNQVNWLNGAWAFWLINEKTEADAVKTIENLNDILILKDGREKKYLDEISALKQQQTKVEGLQEEFAEDERFLREQIQRKDLEISNLMYLQSMDKELIQTLQSRVDLLQKRVDELERVFEIKWTDQLPSDDECRYTHIYGVCALGRFSIEWKAWKESDFKTVYLNDDYLDNVVSIDDAKDVCIKHLKQALKGESSNG